MPSPASSSKIGCGQFGHLGGVRVRLLGNVRDPSGRSDLPAEQKPKNSRRERDSLIRAKLALIAGIPVCRGETLTRD
jgi:hypothetical protein